MLRNRRDFASHPVMSPQIGPMGQRFVVDFDDAIGARVLHAVALRGLERDQPHQLLGRRIHAVDQLAQPVV